MAVKYKIYFTNTTAGQVRVDLDFIGYVGDATTVKGGGFFLEWPDADLTKIADIKRSYLKFEVLNTGLPVSEFFNLGKTDVKVLVYLNDTLNWVGWLDAAPPQYKISDTTFYYELTARDGLHLLEDSVFTDITTSSELPYFSRRISQIISDCLSKTELNLNWWSWINIFPDGADVRDATADPTGLRDPLYITLLNQLTFQNGPREFDSPIVIIQKIAQAFKATFFQAKGEWHFVYIDDWQRGNGLFGTQFDSDGVPQTVSLGVTDQIEIGLRKSFRFRDDDALISFQTKIKDVQHRFEYVAPPSMVRNIDLNDGDFFDQSILQKYSRYELEGWTNTGATAYIYAELETGSSILTETRRLLQFYDDTTNLLSQVTSNSMLVSGGDKFKFECRCGEASGSLDGSLYMQFKVTNSDFPFNSQYLKGDGKWSTTSQIIPLVGSTISFPYFDLVNPREFFIETVDPIPFTYGRLEIIFTQSLNTNAGAVTRKCAVYDMKFDYEQFIAHGKQAKGHYFQAGNTYSKKTEVSEDVYISDHTNIALKGVLLNTSAEPSRYWFRNGITESVRFGQMILRSYWRMFYRNFYRIEADVHNINNGNYFINPLNTVLADALPDREFMISSLRLDLVNSAAAVTFVEIRDTSTTTDYDEIPDIELFQHVNVSNVYVFQEPEQKVPVPWWQGQLAVVLWLGKNLKVKKR